MLSNNYFLIKLIWCNGTTLSITTTLNMDDHSNNFIFYSDEDQLYNNSTPKVEENSSTPN